MWLCNLVFLKCFLVYMFYILSYTKEFQKYLFMIWYSLFQNGLCRLVERGLLLYVTVSLKHVRCGQLSYQIWNSWVCNWGGNSRTLQLPVWKAVWQALNLLNPGTCFWYWRQPQDTLCCSKLHTVQTSLQCVWLSCWNLGKASGKSEKCQAKCHLRDIDYSSRDDSVCLVCIVVRSLMFKQHWTLELYDASTAVIYVYCWPACRAICCWWWMRAWAGLGRTLLSPMRYDIKSLGLELMFVVYCQF